MAQFLAYVLICLCCVRINLVSCVGSGDSELPNENARTDDNHKRSFDSKPNFDNGFSHFTPVVEEKLLNDKSEDLGDENQDRVREHLKPFKSIVLGMYKNYRSTYLGNKTSSDYVKSRKDLAEANSTPMPIESKDATSKEDIPVVTHTRTQTKKRKKKKKSELPYNRYNGSLRYNVGPGVNVSLDMKKDIVEVNLDEDCLKDIFTGRWDDNSDEGRGKKYKMISKILPLFILPFLIQSAIIPFLVSTLKLLLVKSIVVGKVAILLLILSSLRNHYKSSSYDPVPAYYVDHPSRRSEPAFGYKVEGRPTTWIT